MKKLFDGPRIAITVALVDLALVTALLFSREMDEPNLRIALRYTARLSLVLFLLAFSASTLVRMFPSGPTRWLMRNRRYVGLSFAASHIIHLGVILTFTGIVFDWDFLRANTLVTYFGGGLAYVFIFAMALTSNDRSVRMLGRRWKQVHTVGIYYNFLIFFASYAPAAVKAPWKAGPALVLALAIFLRLRLAWQERTKAAQEGNSTR